MLVQSNLIIVINLFHLNSHSIKKILQLIRYTAIKNVYCFIKFKYEFLRIHIFHANSNMNTVVELIWMKNLHHICILSNTVVELIWIFRVHFSYLLATLFACSCLPTPLNAIRVGRASGCAIVCYMPRAKEVRKGMSHGIGLLCTSRYRKRKIWICNGSGRLV